MTHISFVFKSGETLEEILNIVFQENRTEHSS